MNATDLPEAAWEKSRWSNGQANCVEVARNLPSMVAVRDSKDPDGPALLFTRSEWSAFIRGAKEEGLGL